MTDTKLPRRVIDITGQRFGRLTVLEFADYDQHGTAMWRVRCDCGTEFVTRGTHLRYGMTRSCGCIRREVSASRTNAAWRTWAKPVAVIGHGKRIECESLTAAAKLLGCVQSTVSTALREGRSYHEYSFERITK